MPRVSYLNTTATRKESSTRACAGIGTILRGAARNSYQLSKVLNIAPGTAAKKLQNPEKLTLEELFTAGIVLGIPCEDIKSKISW